MSFTQITSSQITHIASLANLLITDKQTESFSKELASVLTYFAQIQNLSTENVPETHQVSHLKNIWREDVVEVSSMLTQKQALANAKKTHNGYIVVPAIIKS